MRIQLSTTQTCSRTMTWLWSIRLCLLSFFWNTNTHHKMIQYIMEFYNKSKRSSNQKIRQHNSTWKWKKYTHDTNRVFIHHPYRLVLWCSGYHVCFTRRRSRVRTSPEPLTFSPYLRLWQNQIIKGSNLDTIRRMRVEDWWRVDNSLFEVCLLPTLDPHINFSPSTDVCQAFFLGTSMYTSPFLHHLGEKWRKR